MARKKKVAIVEEDNNLVRDLSTNAIINTNGNAYERRLEQIQKKQSQEEIDAAQRADIEQLKADMKEMQDIAEHRLEIKAMLKKLGGK